MALNKADTMNRAKLVKQLELLAPALASNELLPQLTKFWFDDRAHEIIAYNDRIGVRVKQENFAFSGCLPGALLLGLLKNSTAGEIAFRQEDDGEIKLVLDGRVKEQKKTTKKKKADDEDEEDEAASADDASAQLALTPVEKLFTWPTKPPAPVGDIDVTELVSALELCLKTTTDDTSIPDQLGVTLIQHKGGKSALYSTTGDCITRVEISADFDDVGGRCVLSTEFCRQVVAMGKGVKKAELCIAKAYATFCVPGVADLYGRLIEVEKPLEFDEQMAHHFPAKLKKSLIGVPEVLPMAVARSLVLAASGDGEARITLTAKEGVLKLLTRAMVGKSPIGKITDTVEGIEHPDVSAVMKPKALKMALDNGYAKMAITEDALIMTTSDSFGTLLIATTPDN